MSPARQSGFSRREQEGFEGQRVPFRVLTRHPPRARASGILGHLGMAERFPSQRIGWLFAACSALACGDEAVDLDAIISELGSHGPNGVGFASLTLKYQPPLGATERSLPTLVWYPARTDASMSPASYVFRTSELARLGAPALRSAPRPLIVFSHGHQAYAAAASRLLEHFASHGYVAVAPTHTDDTFLDPAERGTDIYYLRALDISAVLDHAAEIEAIAGPLNDQRLVFGHSFGGYTAYALMGAGFDVERLRSKCRDAPASLEICSRFDAPRQSIFANGLSDERISGAVAIDPGDFELFGVEGMSAIRRPVLHLSAERSEPDEYEGAKGANADAVRLKLVGGDHNDFIDACQDGILIRCSELAPAEVHRAVKVYSLAFTEHVLGNERAAALLNGNHPVSSVLVVSK